MILEEFYKRLADNKDIRSLHIPRSEIFYIRSAVKAKYNYEASLEEIEIAVLELYEGGEIEAPEALIKELRKNYGSKR